MKRYLALMTATAALVFAAPAHGSTPTPTSMANQTARQEFKQDTGKTALSVRSTCNRKASQEWSRCRSSVRDCRCFSARAVYDFRVRGRSVRVMRRALAHASHVPNPGLAAGHFSVPTKDMCPLGGNKDSCTYLGLAHCKRVGWAHNVSCYRYALDKIRTNGQKLLIVWVATGTIDHRYKPHSLTFRIVRWSAW